MLIEGPKPQIGNYICFLSDFSIWLDFIFCYLKCLKFYECHF